MLNKNHDNIRDFIVIGAGISGCTTAYFLNQNNQSVLLLDKKGIAKAGSGAAGAFISPMIGVNNDFKNFVNDAFKYTLSFYKKFIPSALKQSGIQRIPKDEKDREKFKEYEKYINNIEYILKDKNQFGGGFYFKDGATIDPIKLTEKLVENIEFQKYEVIDITFYKDYWQVGEYKTRNIILATGAYNTLHHEDYLHIKKLWGQRIILKTSSVIPYHLHQNCSISKSTNGIVSIGATYHRGILEQNTTSEDTNQLLELASKIVDLKDVEVIKAVGGARSATDDYYPIIGEIIDSNTTQDKYPNLKNGQKIEFNQLIKYNNIYIINGLGSRAFVLAPYIANNLVNHIVNNKAIFDKCTTYRVFSRWIKRCK